MKSNWKLSSRVVICGLLIVSSSVSWTALSSAEQDRVRPLSSTSDCSKYSCTASGWGCPAAYSCVCITAGQTCGQNVNDPGN
jgi:hypothetical protein